MKLNPVNSSKHFISVEEFINTGKNMFKLNNMQINGFIAYATDTGNYYKTDIKEFIPLLKQYIGK